MERVLKMENMTIGFIGTGNMGGALAKAVFKSGKAGQILLANRSLSKAEKLADLTGGRICSNKDVAANADYIFLGIEPGGLEELACEISPVLSGRNTRFILVSILAGKAVSALEESLGHYPVIRIMPNMPASEGCGFSLYTANSLVTKDEKEYFYHLMKTPLPCGAVAPMDVVLCCDL